MTAERPARTATTEIAGSADDRSTLAPAYTGRMDIDPVPALRLPDIEMEPDAAYRFIHDELMFDGSSRLNLATFVTTWMEPQAEKLMAETFDKNMIDKDEYPRRGDRIPLRQHGRRPVPRAGLIRACARHRRARPSGSSEAVMLGGLALKWRWRDARRGSRRSHRTIVHRAATSRSCWEKFCRYFEVEPRYLPMETGPLVITRRTGP
jgi:glutamate decarboxylase